MEIICAACDSVQVITGPVRSVTTQLDIQMVEAIGGIILKGIWGVGILVILFLAVRLTYKLVNDCLKRADVRVREREERAHAKWMKKNDNALRVLDGKLQAASNELKDKACSFVAKTFADAEQE